jgi:hypothetical protein
MQLDKNITELEVKAIALGIWAAETRVVTNSNPP